MEKIWEKQEWESAHSFGFFQKYYLEQEAPRKLTIAYRQYLMKHKGKKFEEVHKKLPNGRWQSWYGCYDRYGKKIPNAATWEERALEYDRYMQSKKDDRIVDTRNKLFESELLDSDLQKEAWRLAFTSMMDYMKHMKEEADKQGKPYNPSFEITKLYQLGKWREEMSKFARRNVGMPTTINEDRFANSNDEPFRVEYNEPNILPEDVGVGGEELIIDLNSLKKKRGNDGDDD